MATGSAGVLNYQGVLSKIIFANSENGFTIGVLLTHHDERITFSGYIPSIKVGLEVRLYGTWVIHKKFGKQFEISSYVVTVPTNKEGLLKFLSSGIIKGIGTEYAQRLYDHFGDNLSTVLQEHPERIQEVPGFGERRAQLIGAAWQEHAAALQTLMFLQSHGLSPAYAARVFRHYKQQTVMVVQQNPYILAREVWGIGFIIADRMAQHMGYTGADPRRIQAAVWYVLTTQQQSGHVYMEQEALITAVGKLLVSEVASADVLASMDTMVQSQELIVLHEENHHLYARPEDYRIEQRLAEHVVRLHRAGPGRTLDVDAIGKRLSGADVALHELQVAGIAMALRAACAIVTGGPGTGKTTLTRFLIQILIDEGIRFRLVAPTGRAAKRMTESTGCPATTIHRLLELEPATGAFAHHERHPLDVDMVIVDEASMLDHHLALALVRAIPAGARVLFLGDTDQLPSVGPGNVLGDMLACAHIPRVQLTQIFRQAQHSLITLNAHRIIAGTPPIARGASQQDDFIYVSCEDPEQVVDKVLHEVFPELARRNIVPENTMIITPLHRGAAGTYVLNQAVQEYMTRGVQGARAHVVGGGSTLRVQDRVMQLRNNYEKSVFNGDIGVISHIDTDLKVITVRFAESLVVYEEHEWAELALAYAITVHKSQGSEYDAVIVPVYTQHYTLLSRNLLYTAVTRAKKLCIMIGQKKAVYMALSKQSTQHARITRLTQWLNDMFGS